MKICVHGMGYIGLATAALFANAGHDVTGYDPNKQLVEELHAGNPQTTEAELRAFVLSALDNGLEPSHSPTEAECHLVCVPTPYNDDTNYADLTYVEEAGHTISEYLRAGDVVILESTVPPGTTEGEFARILSTSGLVPGIDFELAHCPEMVLPGNITYEIVHNDRIIGGVTPRSTKRVIDLYRTVSKGAIRQAPDATTAEFVKLAQNASRDVTIAFANELARIAHDYGIESRAAIELANVHPRVEILNPGPGVGGHCLPIDPWFLGQSSDSLDLIKTARRVNDGMVDFVVELLDAELGSTEQRVIAILGVAYKGNVDDYRHSPGLRLAERLRGATETHDTELEIATTDGGYPDWDDSETDVLLYDPFVRDDGTLGLVSIDEALQGADAIVITAAHDEFAELDPFEIANHVARPVVIDTPAVLDEQLWRAANFDYMRL